MGWVTMWIQQISKSKDKIKELWTKIINKQSIIGIEKSFIWAKLRTIARKTASQINLRNGSGEPWFLAQFYVLSEQRTSKNQGYTPWRFKKKSDQHVYIESVWLWHLGSGLIIEGVPALASQEGRHLIFIFNMDSLYFWSMHPFL